MIEMRVKPELRVAVKTCLENKISELTHVSFQTLSQGHFDPKGKSKDLYYS